MPLVPKLSLGTRGISGKETIFLYYIALWLFFKRIGIASLTYLPGSVAQDKSGFSQRNSVFLKNRVSGKNESLIRTYQSS
jgi:hypothetical protein